MRSSTQDTMLFVVVLTMCLTRLVLAGVDIRLPPKIVRGPLVEKIFRPDEDVTLECIAEGVPKPRYTWTKDGLVLEPKPNVIFTESGIQISQLSVFDEGYYQCQAENQYGRSLSNTTSLRRAYIGTYHASPPTDYFGLEEGLPHVIKYSPLKVYPAPTFSWHIADGVTDNSPKIIQTSKRIQIDEDGNLHFSYLLASDAQDGKLYKCNVLNPYVDLTVGGSYSRLHITPKGVREFAPTYAFGSKNPVVAVLGRNVTLRCFFSGYPDPSLTWSKVNGSMPVGRYSLLNFNTEFHIRDVKQSDEGDYKCRASNTVAFRDEIIQIDVQSAPSFVRQDDRPSNKNATEGENVIFTCNATAEPLADIKWLKNGDPLDANSMPPRMRLINNGKQLVIERVCKDCTDGSRDTDLMVVQCNASNTHGYIFSDAYLNILEKTVITERPQDVHLEFDKLKAEFQCAGTTDDSTQLKVTWYRVMTDGNPNTPVYNSTHMTVSSNGNKLTFQVTEETLDAWPKLRGKYRCHVTNGYSNDFADCTLDVDDPPPPPVPEETLPGMEPTTSSDVDAVPLVGASLMDFWWILVIVVAILLIVILIIICCLCCRRRKGDTYFVDKKERLDHKDPEKELHDSALQPYHRRDPETLKGSRASLGDSMRGESDEDDDLAEYGDIDAGKFTEDGSFIGDYATEQRKRGRPGESVA